MPTGPIANPLQRPVGALLTPVEPLPIESSLRVAATAMVEDGVPGLPVVRDAIYVGTLLESDLSRALAEGADIDSSVSEWIVSGRPTVSLYSTGAEALRAMADSALPLVSVVDDRGVPLGIVTPGRLIQPPEIPVRPKLVGGMATPFGVYLTNGAVRGGVPQWALFVTGMAMFGLFLLASYVSLSITHLLPLEWITHPAAGPIAEASVFVFFLIGLRLVPLSGIHGAEHMVVHAIERGEALIPETVRRMPRVHPRCGTNLAVAAMVFLGLFGLDWTPEYELRLLVAALVTALTWRPLGAAVQQWVTTKRPTEKQLAMGIESGKDLLQRYQTAQFARPSVLARLVNSGLFHIMAGAILIQMIVFGVMVLLNVPPEWRVF